MKIFRFISLLIVLALLIVPSFIYSVPLYATSSTTPSLQEAFNTGGDASPTGDSAKIYGDNYCAMQFTTNATAHTVTKIKVRIKRVGSPSYVYMGLRTATAGKPDSTDDIMTFVSWDGTKLPADYGWVTFDISTSLSTVTALSGSTEYAIVINATGGASDYVLWNIDAGGGAGVNNLSHSTDAGITWTTDAPSDALYEVYGVTAMSIVSAREFDSYLTSGDMLFTFEYFNVYSPYFDNTANPNTLFYFQLLASDDTTVLAQTTMRAWGDRPGSIYLSASSVTAITPKSTLYIKMIGTFSPYPSVEHLLTSDEWLGKASPLSTHTDNYLLNAYDKITGQNDYSNLDQWVRDTASNIDKYNKTIGITTSLTKYIQNKGIVLSADSEGDSIFINGIPSLNYVRPNLFEVVTIEPSIDTTVWNNTYNNSASFDTIVGTTVSGDMDSLGALFGVTATAANGTEQGISVAQKTMGAVLMIVAVVLALFGLFAVGSGFAPVSLFLSMPLMFWGAQIRAIDIRLIGLIIFFLFFLCIRKYIWVEG